LGKSALIISTPHFGHFIQAKKEAKNLKGGAVALPAGNQPVQRISANCHALGQGGWFKKEREFFSFRGLGAKKRRQKKLGAKGAKELPVQRKLLHCQLPASAEGIK
jgi:hypothetical protein